MEKERQISNAVKCLTGAFSLGMHSTKETINGTSALEVLNEKPPKPLKPIQTILFTQKPSVLLFTIKLFL